MLTKLLCRLFLINGTKVLWKFKINFYEEFFFKQLKKWALDCIKNYCFYSKIHFWSYSKNESDVNYWDIKNGRKDLSLVTPFTVFNKYFFWMPPDGLSFLQVSEKKLELSISMYGKNSTYGIDNFYVRKQFYVW